MSGPLVIGHRGASGHRPEHTAAAYRLAWRSGADSVEPDVVATRDGVLVCRHDLELSRTTDVADHPELAHLRRRQVVDGQVEEGWFVHDLDLDQLRTLRARERWPRRRRRSAAFDDRLPILTLAELLELREQESARAGRALGVHVELKHGAHLAGLGLPLVEPLVDLLRQHRLTTALAPLTVMAFEADLLRGLRREVDVDLVQLVDKHQTKALRRGRLHKVGEYATGVGLHKQLALPRDAEGRSTGPGPAVERVQSRGLDVLVWTLRDENRYLPTELQVPGPSRRHGHADREVQALLALGVDGLLCDHPETAVEVISRRTAAVAV
ncbi:glycerophosphodiester phosphodiesterase family protein [Nocardioides aurantiacus]|uniref:glycerophosphodiester phosphodiesterase n=1 Tax=Nocardioides aurantiacus TaxID=86796 RepID=A0A3N2CR85_9ACTN|nr:glycerophosphodiester phosphodiesterase family protein [Nocardioides aurantiacus]ROR90057.1 glycerophosphoryl diester phosphodiesterase [Nocardioides aurantiacus]